MEKSENRKEKIEKLMNEIHGRFVPTFYWENHPPMEYWYNSVNDSIYVETGDEIKVRFESNELTKKYIENLIDELEDKLIVKYNLEVIKD